MLFYGPYTDDNNRVMSEQEVLADMISKPTDPTEPSRCSMDEVCQQFRYAMILNRGKDIYNNYQRLFGETLSHCNVLLKYYKEYSCRCEYIYDKEKEHYREPSIIEMMEARKNFKPSLRQQALELDPTNKERREKAKVLDEIEK